MSGPTPEDAELFGEDLIAFAQRAAAPVVDARVGLLENQVGQLKSQLENERQRAAQERVHGALDADPTLANRWRQLNTDPGFLDWLSREDELSGRKRQELLSQAYRAGIPERCASFFRSYLMESTPAHSRTQHRQPFEGGQPRPAVTVTDLDPRRLWRREEISRFYDQCRRGFFHGREIERGQIEAEIARAAKEGRVVNPPARMLDER